MKTNRIIPRRLWGKDHWSTFAYVDSCVTGRGGHLQIVRMRCDPKTHPQFAHRGSDRFLGTVLRDGSVVAGHDDWSCIDDLEADGLLENRRTGLHPQFALTTKGEKCAIALRKHKARGGSFKDFRFRAGRADSRDISVRGDTYEKLKKKAQAEGVSVRVLTEQIVSKHLDRVEGGR